MATLIIAEHDDAHLNDATAKTLTAAQALGQPVDILVAGRSAKAAADAAAQLAGVRTVLLAEGDSLAERRAEPLADLVRRRRRPARTSRRASPPCST
jgi:electron transfer flavoprotein alpha subunit